MTRYLSVADYVLRFGDQEATRLTSEGVQPPARDDTKIEAAINDSEDEIDGYLSRRYQLPLATTPRVVASWTARLAREKLHKTRPIPEVVREADLVRQQLAQVSSGTFRLIDVEGVAEPSSADRSAQTSGVVRPTSMADALADYTRLGPGAGCEPRWRQ
jgi:phage gp36-like protein